MHLLTKKRFVVFHHHRLRRHHHHDNHILMCQLTLGLQARISRSNKGELRTSELIPQWGMRCQLSRPAIKL